MKLTPLNLVELTQLNWIKLIQLNSIQLRTTTSTILLLNNSINWVELSH